MFNLFIHFHTCFFTGEVVGSVALGGLNIPPNFQELLIVYGSMQDRT